jgi:hypothetical protein
MPCNRVGLTDGWEATLDAALSHIHNLSWCGAAGRVPQRHQERPSFSATSCSARAPRPQTSRSSRHAAEGGGGEHPCLPGRAGLRQ